MMWTLWLLGLIAALLRTASAADSVIYRDPDTGLVFASSFQAYKIDGRGITFRVAVPDDAASNTSYDAVVQVVVPNDVGWAGLSWGGGMQRSPLLVMWRGTSNNPVLSSRWATAYALPQMYTGAQYTLFKTGTKSNSTHWQFTALCKGCTAWDSGSGAMRYLSPRGGNRLAWAYSPTKPSNPNSPSSNITYHEAHGYWSHDFTQAANTNFKMIVQKLTPQPKAARSGSGVD